MGFSSVPSVDLECRQGLGDTLRPALGTACPLPPTVVVFTVGILTGFLAKQTSSQKLFFPETVNFMSKML